MPRLGLDPIKTHFPGVGNLLFIGPRGPHGGMAGPGDPVGSQSSPPPRYTCTHSTKYFKRHFTENKANTTKKRRFKKVVKIKKSCRSRMFRGKLCPSQGSEIINIYKIIRI